MINFDVGTQKGYAGYPKAEEGPTTEYKSAPTSNPVLRGLPLAIAGSACVVRHFTKRCYL